MHLLPQQLRHVHSWIIALVKCFQWNYFLSKMLRWQSSRRTKRAGQGGSLLLPWQQHLGSSSWDCLLSQSDTARLYNLWHPARWISLRGLEREQTPMHAWSKFFIKTAFKFSNQKQASMSCPFGATGLGFEWRCLRKSCHCEIFHSVKGVYFCSQSVMLLTTRFCWQAAALTSSLIYPCVHFPFALENAWGVQASLINVPNGTVWYLYLKKKKKKKQTNKQTKKLLRDWMP